MIGTTDQLPRAVHPSGLSPLTPGQGSTILQSAEGKSQFPGGFLNPMRLGAATELPEIADEKDVTIAILEGKGILRLHEETIPLEPGRLVFIPAHLPHTIQTLTTLTFLLDRCEADPNTHNSAWLITL